MVLIKGYKEVDFEEFMDTMNFYRSERSFAEMAVHIRKTSDTAKNAFRTDKQVVTDSILTKVAEFIGIECFIVNYNGDKYFYIKKQITNGKEV